MRVEIVSYKKHKVNKVLNIVYVIIVGLGIGLMIKGRGGSPSFYSQFHAPTWLYVFTVLILLIFIILLFANTFSGIPRVGFIEFDPNKNVLVISNKKKTLKLPFGEIKQLKIVPNYMKDTLDARKSRKLQITTDRDSLEYEVLIRPDEEDKINEIFS